MLVAVEGPTKAGKTTLCRNLQARLTDMGLRSFDLNDTLEKDLTLRTVQLITKDVTSALSPFEELCFYAIRLSRKVYGIMQLLQDNPEVILVDRFRWSLLVFSQTVRGMEADFVERVIEEATEGLTPDLTICLDVRMETIIERENGFPRTRKNMDLLSFHDHYRQHLRQLVGASPCAALFSTDGLSPDEVANAATAWIVTARANPQGGNHGRQGGNHGRVIAGGF